jgi:hypothetical protein
MLFLFWLVYFWTTLTGVLYLIQSRVFLFSRTDHLCKRKPPLLRRQQPPPWFPPATSAASTMMKVRPPLHHWLHWGGGWATRFEAEVPLLAAKKVVSVLQDDSGSDGEGYVNDDLGSDDGEGCGSDDSEDKAMHIPFRMTPRIMWFKCPICLREEYDLEAKMVLHVLEVIKQDAGMPEVDEWHHQGLQARRRRWSDLFVHISLMC